MRLSDTEKRYVLLKDTEIFPKCGEKMGFPAVPIPDGT